ncbi:MAG TPA: glycosyltransferase family 1 protein [Acidobacteria bacterium]|nr:glycosyltransferase family 1 protein [Acidobacteriota bacterium]
MGIRLALDARKLTDFGIGTYVTNLIAGFARRTDVELTLLVRGGHVERARGLAPDARILEVNAREYTVTEHLELPMALFRENVDLVHIPHYVLPFFLRQPAVVTVHDIIQLYYPPPHRQEAAVRYLRFFIGRALRRARGVITVSRSSRNDLVRIFGADPSRITVIPNGVDPSLAERPPRAELEALRDRYGLKPPLILTVGNDKPHKNTDVVLRAFHRAVRHGKLPGQLVLVGGIVPGSSLSERARRMGLGERVRVLGRLPWRELVCLYHLSSAMVHVALYEGFGLPILEAMCAGLPVVTSNLGAMRELGEGAALLVNPLSVQEVAEAMERVLIDDPLRRRMVEGGRRRADTMTWQATVEATMGVYREALGGGKP